MNTPPSNKADAQSSAIPAWLFRVALVFACIAISYLAFTQFPENGPDLGWDKFNHAAAFYVLAFLVDFSIPRTRFGLAKFGMLIAYGICIEVVQYLLPYRESSFEDLFADMVGILAYLLSTPILARLPLLRARWRLNPS
ncbi:MAG: VanZ family protein [Chromatiales bacterium]|nr:VanZ family protein [Chromatiales bacterium]